MAIGQDEDYVHQIAGRVWPFPGTHSHPGAAMDGRFPAQEAEM